MSAERGLTRVKIVGNLVRLTDRKMLLFSVQLNVRISTKKEGK